MDAYKLQFLINNRETCNYTIGNSIYLPRNFSKADVVTTDDSIHASVGQTAFCDHQITC